MTKEKLEDYLDHVMIEEQRKYELEKIGKYAYQKKKAWENERYQYVEKPEDVKPLRKKYIGYSYLKSNTVCWNRMIMGLQRIETVQNFVRWKRKNWHTTKKQQPAG